MGLASPGVWDGTVRLETTDKLIQEIITSKDFDPNIKIDCIVWETVDGKLGKGEHAPSPFLNQIIGFSSLTTVSLLLKAGADPNLKDATQYARNAMLSFTHHIAYFEIPTICDLNATLSALLQAGAHISMKDGLGHDSPWYLEEAIRRFNDSKNRKQFANVKLQTLREMLSTLSPK